MSLFLGYLGLIAIAEMALDTLLGFTVRLWVPPVAALFGPSAPFAIGTLAGNLRPHVIHLVLATTFLLVSRLTWLATQLREKAHDSESEVSV